MAQGVLRELYKHGQSVWLDNISREAIDSGHIARRLAQGVRGETSNPTIFHRAVTGSSVYDGLIADCASRGLSAEATYEEIATRDVRDAADLLRPVCDESDFRDGFVSLEVSPHLAHDADATVADALRLHAKIDRPNVMIKVPATDEGFEAIGRLTRRGICINVTLIFSGRQYRWSAKRYLEGATARLSAGGEVHHLTSVASVFISRIDTLIDRLLEERAQAHPADAERILALRGVAGVANSKLIYRDFELLAAASMEQDLCVCGGSVQRVLWASTSSKNPAYPDTKYVDDLVGRATVTTLPEETIDALLDHGEVRPDTVLRGRDEAYLHFIRLKELGIDPEAVFRRLLDEGVGKFAASYDALVSAIGQRMEALAAKG